MSGIVSEESVFRSTLELASVRSAGGETGSLQDPLGFLDVLNAFNSVVRDLTIQDSSLTTVCYQALLLMDASSDLMVPMELVSSLMTDLPF